MPLDLAAEVHGTGSPLVVLHGLFGWRRNWTGIARELASRHEVHALDLRNHGDSPWSGDMSLQAMAADVGRYLQTHGLAPAPVIGHSMGGKVAAWMALSQPQAVRRLMVVDVAPVAYDHGFERFVAAMRAVPATSLSRRSEADSCLAEAIREPSVRAFLLQNLVTAGSRLRWRLNLDAIDTNMPAIAGFPTPPLGSAYEGPALFVRGERSDYVLREHEPTIRSLFPKAEIETIAGAGHWVHADAPSDFLRCVRTFLA